MRTLIYLLYQRVFHSHNVLLILMLFFWVLFLGHPFFWVPPQKTFIYLFSYSSANPQPPSFSPTLLIYPPFDFFPRLSLHSTPLPPPFTPTRHQIQPQPFLTNTHQSISNN